MKNDLASALMLSILLASLFTIGVHVGYSEGKKEHKQTNQPVIVWNDDQESIPEDGKTVKIEQTVNDTIYIGNVK